MIKQCIASIVNLNLAGLKKQNETKSLQKLLDLCADPQSTKSNTTKYYRNPSIIDKLAWPLKTKSIS